MERPILEGQGLGKTYRLGSNDVRALDNVNVEVQPGELVAIMGPSGCGKSTLLHLLTGIDTPTAGRVLLNGDDVSGRSAEERALLRRTHMGLLFQAHGLMPGLTVGENVALPLTLAEVERDARAERATVLLTMVGLADRMGDLPDDLSGGQRQRVALARALINNPAVVLADEPTGSLDSTTAQSVLDAMVKLLRARGTALVMVTHDSQAAALADRTLYLSDGHVVTGQQLERQTTGREVYT